MTAGSAQAEQTTAPTIEFLEFLGEGIKVEGEYLDPVNYEDIGTTNETNQKSKAQNDEK